MIEHMDRSSFLDSGFWDGIGKITPLSNILFFYYASCNFFFNYLVLLFLLRAPPHRTFENQTEQRRRYTANSVGGKRIYGLLNVIYVHNKRRQMRYNARVII